MNFFLFKNKSLERNQEREKSISNMEYLKNVVLKFLTFTSQQEKAQLLPVLSTMLKLSQEEQHVIMNAKGNETLIIYASFVFIK